METKYIVMLAIAVGVALYFYLTLSIDAAWRKNIKRGIPCDFYVNEDRLHGTIQHIEHESGQVVVTDAELRGHILSIRDVYPPYPSIFSF